MTQLSLTPDLKPDRALLACQHYAAINIDKHPRRADHWYSAVYCDRCRRKHEVVLVAWGKKAG